MKDLVALNLHMIVTIVDGGTGPMCSTFILSMSVAIAAQIEGRDPIIDGFGVVAMIALTPILSTLVLGYIYKRKDEKDRIEKERLQKLGESK